MRERERAHIQAPLFQTSCVSGGKKLLLSSEQEKHKMASWFATGCVYLEGDCILSRVIMCVRVRVCLCVCV